MIGTLHLHGRISDDDRSTRVHFSPYLHHGPLLRIELQLQFLHTPVLFLQTLIECLHGSCSVSEIVDLIRCKTDSLALFFCKIRKDRLQTADILHNLRDFLLHLHIFCLFLRIHTNFHYDRRAYGEAIADYEEAARRYPDLPTVHRNLALAYYNVKKQPQRAYEEMEKAFALDETDARVYLELDQLKKRLNVPVKERWSDMEKHFDLVESRDDLYLEYVTLLNTLGENAKALDLIMVRKFHQWEGGEGKVAAQYLTALYQLAKAAVAKEDYAEAKELLLRAVDEYPHNLGEGKLESAQENNLYYLLGLVQEKMGETEEAFVNLTKACYGESEPVGMMYYNDQPPEMIYYQGLAYRKLGDEEQAVQRFCKLVDYGKEHIGDEIKIDYFAVSLPDLLIFEEDLKERNRKHCLFMMSLGLKGLGRTDEAEKCAQQLLAMDNAHQGIRVHDL